MSVEEHYAPLFLPTGAIYADGDSVLTIDGDMTFANNTSGEYGGGETQRSPTHIQCETTWLLTGKR